MKTIKVRKKIHMPKRIIKRFRWGVAGCGNYLEKSFLPSLTLLPKSKLVSVYSSSVKRAEFIKNKFGGESHFDKFEDFLRSGIDAVYISGANAHHYDRVIKAAEAGLNILCEKPLALNSKEAAKMVDACRKNKVMLAVNYINRFHPLTRKAKELIEDGRIGQIVSISANFNIDYAPDKNYRFDPALSGGGVLRDLGTHMIDLLHFFGGEISEISGFLDNLIYKSDSEDFAIALVKFKKGGYGQFRVSYCSGRAFNRVELTGHKGCIGIENLFTKNISSKLTINTTGAPRIALRKKSNRQAALLRSVQKSFKKNLPLLSSGEDGLMNMQIMEKLEKLAR